jgi:uncharacterized protein (DUF2384 family)
LIEALTNLETFDALRRRTEHSLKLAAEARVRPKITAEEPRKSTLEQQIGSETLEQALEVFGTVEEVETWISREQPGLNGQIPLSLIKTEEGRQIVMDLLQRMGYGPY